VNPHAEHPRSITFPTFHPTDQSDTPDQSDHMHPSFNPKVPESRPGRPTSQLKPLIHLPIHVKRARSFQTLKSRG
jgi:hypothetical protein